MAALGPGCNRVFIPAISPVLPPEPHSFQLSIGSSFLGRTCFFTGSDVLTKKELHKSLKVATHKKPCCVILADMCLDLFVDQGLGFVLLSHRGLELYISPMGEGVSSSVISIEPCFWKVLCCKISF